MGPLLYVKTPSRYPLSVYIKLSMDADSGFAWNRVLAVCCIAGYAQAVIDPLLSEEMTRRSDDEKINTALEKVKDVTPAPAEKPSWKTLTLIRQHSAWW